MCEEITNIDELIYKLMNIRKEVGFNAEVYFKDEHDDEYYRLTLRVDMEDDVVIEGI